MSARAKLYAGLGSHAVRATILMLDHKGIDYRTVMLPVGTQRLLRLRGFPGGTVPALVLDGRKVQTNRAIARALDEACPEPPLFPRDAARRAEVEEAERWADEELQMPVRRLAFAAGMDWPGTLVDRGDDGRLGPLLWRTAWARRLGLPGLRRLFDVNRETERELLAELPAMLDRIDAWIEAGVLNGDELNAADFAVAGSLGLLSYRSDLRPELESRPLIRLLDRVLPASQAAA